MRVSHLSKRAPLALALMLLAGCDNPIKGAYKVSMVNDGVPDRTVGIAVIQEHNISADGADVPVTSWVEEEGAITAMDQDGKRIIRFEILENNDLKQETPSGTLIFNRFEL